MSIGRMGEKSGKREKGDEGTGNREQGTGSAAAAYPVGAAPNTSYTTVQSRTPSDPLRGPPPSGREAFFLKAPSLRELSAKQTEGALGV